MAFWDSVKRFGQGVYNQVRMGEGKTFSDAYNTPEEERRRRAREAAKQAPQTQQPQNTQYVNGLVSGGGVRAQEDRRREVARNAARQQVQNPIGGFLSGVLSKGKDVVDLAQKGVEFNVDLLKNPEKLVDAGETARKAIINATPPAQLYNRIRTDQRVQQARQETSRQEQEINNQVKELFSGQASNLGEGIKYLSDRRGELQKNDKKLLLALLDANRQLAADRRTIEEGNLQNVDPVGILEDALVFGGEPVANLTREIFTRGPARIVKEIESNKLAKAMVPFIGETSKGIDVAQESNLGKFIFGRGKVDKASDDIKSFTKDIPILRDIFKYAPLATAGGIAINLPGIGGTSKVGKFAKASKELSLVDNVDDVVKVIGKYDDLNKLFGEVDDTLKPILLERLAKETKPKEIQKSIRGSLEATKRLQLEAPQVGKNVGDGGTDLTKYSQEEIIADSKRVGDRMAIVDEAEARAVAARKDMTVEPKADPLESLKQEARKYKSAEEFVNSKINAYRATSETYNPLKVSLGGNKKQFGTYVTNDLETAKAYLDNRNTIIDNLHLTDKAKVATESDLPKKFRINELSDYKKFGGPQEWQQKAAKWAKDNGYDVMDFGGRNNMTVVNPEALKTKQQLTDLYNQATQSQPPKSTIESLKQEARKYKSAEEFVNSQIKRPQATDNVWQDTLPSGSRPDSIQKITKSGGNPLYHDTNADSVLSILDSGQIKASQAPFSSIAGQGKRVSTTRNFDNYSRYNKSPYRLVIDESKTGQRAIPDNREEFESIFKMGVPTKSVDSVAIDVTNPALLGDIRSGKLADVIKKAKDKGIVVEPFEGKVLPNEGANAEIQTMTSRAFSDTFPEYNTKLKQLTDLYNQAKTVAPVESKGVDNTLDELQNLQPEEIAKIDDLAKQAGFKGLDDVAQSLKPKAVSNISEATPSKAPVDVVSDVKNEVALAPRTTDEAVREIAGALGRDIGEVDESLGTSAKAISAITGGKFTNTRKLNPFRLLSDYLGGGVAKQGEKAITGKGSKTLRGIEGFFGGAGRTADVKQIPRQFEGRLANIGDLVGKANKESNRILDSIKDARKQLDLVMRDKAYIKRVYGDDAKKLSPDNLPPELKKVYEQYTDANKVVNDINLQTKVIDKAQWLGGTKGQHIARKFDIPKGEKEVIRDHVRALFDQTAGVKRKDISKFEDELIALLDKDPIKAIEFRTEMALRNLAFTEALDGFKANNFIKNVAPNKGFIQMTGKRWGKYDGKFIERGAYEQLSGNRQFLSDMSTSFNNLLETYQRSGVGWLDRIQKAFKTILNVGTSVGNLLSNPFLFNLGAGTNPVTQLYDMAGAFKQMRKGMSEGNVYLARELGVIGGDTGRILTGSSNKAASALGDATIGIPRKVLNKAGQIYGGIDDVAKLGLFNRLIKKGVDPQDAALEVARFTQDYNNVGRTVQLIADTPVMGKPFARFSPELVRIIKNNVTRAPHRIIAGVAGLAYLNNRLSKDANETDEERRTREDAVGQTMIPGTAWINKQMGGPERDVSLNIPINDSAVNIARMVGLNFPIEPGIDPSRALLEQLIPVEIPIRKNAIGETVFDPTKIVTSMTFRPIIEQVFDQNFMGKKISDPTNVTYDSQGNVMKNTPPSTKDQLINRGLAFGASVLPMGYEATSIGSSIAGRPGPTGKNRSVIDSVLRSIGLKAEKNDPEARAKRTDTANFFEVTKPAQDKFLQENKDLESLYFQVFPKTKDRNTGKKISDQISPEKWAKVSAEKSGRLFEFMKSQAVEANKRDKTQPIDPIYKLKKDQAREVLRLRARPTGDDVEREQTLRANTDWYPKLEKDERAYYKDLSKYFDKLKKEGVDIDSSLNDRVKKYNNVKYPAQPKLLKDYYKISNKDQAKAYLKQFDKDWVSSQFDKDSANRLEYVNAKRAIEGASPISKKEWDNVTFGYEDDESKVATKLYFKNKGKGYDYGSSGKGGKGGKSGKTAKDKRVPLSSLTSYIRGLGTDIPDVASQIRAPEVRLNLPRPVASRAKRVKINFRG